MVPLGTDSVLLFRIPAFCYLSLESLHCPQFHMERKNFPFLPNGRKDFQVSAQTNGGVGRAGVNRGHLEVDMGP